MYTAILTCNKKIFSQITVEKRVKRISKYLKIFQHFTTLNHRMLKHEVNMFLHVELHHIISLKKDKI